MNKPIIVIGGGGHSKVLLETLINNDCEIIGITDADISKVGSQILGIPIIGSDEKILKYKADDIMLVNGLGSTSSQRLRGECYNDFKRKGYSFASVVNTHALVAVDVYIYEGVQLMAGCIIQPGSTIEANTLVNTGSCIDHDCYIGHNVHIAPGAVICGDVKIGKNTFIGAGSVVIQGVEIGEEVLIAAGSVVVRSVQDGAKLKGLPAKANKSLTK